MRTLLIYFLQVIIASGLLYSYYYFFLRNRKFHQYNRFYLLASTIISLVIPLLQFNIRVASHNDIAAMYQMMADIRAGNSTVVNDKISFFSNWQNIGLLIFWLMFAILFSRLVVSILYFTRLGKKYPVLKMENFSFMNTQEPGTPFSFFRWLFWNDSISIESAEGQKIFRHELFHIRQKHSWDIIYLELLSVFFWINPFFHLIKRETKAIHEFLADQFAAGKDDKWDYAELLVMQILQTRQRLVNPFFQNQIKRRMAMITNSSNPGFQYLRKLMVLPLAFLIVSVIAVNCTSKDIKKEVKAEQKTEAPVISKEVILDSARMAEQMKKDLQSTETGPQPSFPGGQAAWASFLRKHLNPNVPVDNGATEGRYKVLVLFHVDKDGHVSNLNPVTHWGYGMEEEVLRVMKLCPRWVPAVKDGKAIDAYKQQPVTFEIVSE